MANRRMIAADLFEDDTICAMSVLGRFIWTGIIVACADDQGRMIDNTAIIRAKVFPLDQDVKDGDIESALQYLNLESKIARYVAGKKRLIQIVNWWRYQSPSWAMPSKYPPPEGWIDREKYHTPGITNHVTKTHWDLPGGYQNQFLPTALPSALPKSTDELRGDELRGVEVGAPTPATSSKSTAKTIPAILGRIGMSAIPPDELARIEQITCMIESHGPERTEEALKDAAQKWKATKNKNGRPYPITNMAWVDWAQNELDAGSNGNGKITWAIWDTMTDEQRQAYVNAGGSIPHE